MNNLKNKRFDIVFITSLPSFYKINLYNELAKKSNIFVIFIANSSQIRTKDFIDFNAKFDYIILYNGNIEDKKQTSFKLVSILFYINYRRLIVGGWDLFEYWIAIIVSKKSLNAIAVESSIYESKIKGISAIAKKIFLSKISYVYASGELQKQLVQALGFKNNIIVTKGVGLFNKIDYLEIKKEFQKSFIYIGRLSEEKNLFYLVEVFNNLPSYNLKIIGKGVLKDKLKSIAKKNITILEHIPNDKLYKIYLENDVLILPSYSEPWGLVVEEALYFGMPVIVSNKVGCSYDMVKKYDSGIVFDIKDKKALKEAILTIETKYCQYKKNVLKIDFNKLFQKQINSYLL